METVWASYAEDGVTVNGVFRCDQMGEPPTVELPADDPAVQAYLHPPPPIPPQPTTASTLGLMRAFEEIGQWLTVKDAITAAGQQDEWYMAIEIERSAVDALGLALTPEQLDEIFIRAWELAAKAATEPMPESLKRRSGRR
jgi:hypothetical protein